PALSTLSLHDALPISIEHLLELLDVTVLDRAIAGHGQLAAEIEQLVLNLRQRFADRRRQSRYGEHDADRAVGFVHRAVRFDAAIDRKSTRLNSSHVKI